MKLTELKGQTEAGELKKQKRGEEANLPVPRIVLVSMISGNTHRRHTVDAYLHSTTDTTDSTLIAKTQFPIYEFDVGQQKVLKKAKSALENIEGLPPEIPFHWSS